MWDVQQMSVQIKSRSTAACRIIDMFKPVFTEIQTIIVTHGIKDVLRNGIKAALSIFTGGKRDQTVFYFRMALREPCPGGG